MNAIDLANRRALITGGAQGIGYAVAERFLASGADVIIWDVAADALDPEWPPCVATLQSEP